MALENTGLPNSGVTTSYKFLYDSSLAGGGGPEPARTTQLMQNCDGDFSLMQNWFLGVAFPFSEPMQVDVQGGGGTASWGPPVDLNASSNDAGYLRMLLIAEVTEMFMKSQAAALHTSGWFPGNEGSLGEGLSRFLAEQFLLQNGVGIGEFPSWGWTANSWLQSPDWPDWINHVDPTGDTTYIEIGCSILFIYYLFVNLNFTINQIIAAAAANLAGVYANLTGDNGDPFPFFKRLLQAYPGTAGISSGTNLDNPFPVGLVSIWEEKSTFGFDEVQDVITQSNGVFSGAFWVVVEGFSKTSFNALAIAVQLDGSLTTTAGITVSQSATYAIDYEDAGKPDAPQRIRIPYDIRFTAAANGAFPPMGSTGENELDLHAELQIAGQKVNGSDAYAAFELVAGADPYFTNVDPSQGNVFYLSQDLRVFTVTPDLNPAPIPGAPAFVGNDANGAYGYIQSLLGYLNGNASFATGTADPFAAFPDQSGAYTGDASVTPVTLTSPPHNNFNFAVARVRLRGSAAAPAHNVKVFFRLWVSQSADTDYQPNTTYLSTPDMAGLPGAPAVGAGTTTIPFFATGNLTTNTDYGANGVNNQPITIASGDTAWAYFGCFLDVYDPAYLVNGQQVQTWLAGTHHCLVAQIACDSAPIPTNAQVTPSPENSDKLAQRNLQVTLSDNPGGRATHRVPQTFDVRPSPVHYADNPDQMPDELMIDWGEVPVGATAWIYWPQVNAAEVVKLADAHYAFHALEMTDPHTIQCRVARAVTYVPIPPDAGENFAALLTIDLPLSVKTGQEFDVVVRRVATARGAVRPPPPPPQAARAARAARAGSRAGAAQAHAPAATHGFGPGTDATHGFGPEPERRGVAPATAAPAAAALRLWRYTTGAFRVRIPISEPRQMLPLEENTLAIMKWRLGAMPLSSRWHPVLRRYVEYVEGRVRGLGGDPDKIAPSPGGYSVVLPEPGRETRDYYGKVCRVAFDCHGDFEGFDLDECAGDRGFTARDAGLGKLILRAFRLRFRLRVVVREPGRRVVRVEVVE